MPTKPGSRVRSGISELAFIGEGFDPGGMSGLNPTGWVLMPL